MRARFLACLAAVALGGCGSKKAAAPAGRLVVALTVDWEGAYISLEGLDMMDAVRRDLGDPPITHFVSAGYFSKPKLDPEVLRALHDELRPGDELAVHLHAWKSLAVAAGLTPKLAPSFLTGTDKLLEFEDGDVGFDTDLDAYTVPELRALLRTSRELLGKAKHPVSKSFRAGGYLGTPKVMQALRDEGFTVDSSATDYHQLDEREHEFLPGRVKALWPDVDAGKQPWVVQAKSGPIVEMPIAAFADYATADEIVAAIEAARARLAKDPAHDVFVVVGFHQETGADFGGRVREAFAKLRADPGLAKAMMFTTIEAAALMAQPK